MEDRVVRALDVLAKATKASDGILLDRAAAAAESGSTSLCRPWSRRDFLARLRTFTPGRWFAKVTKREEQATCPSQSHSLTHSLCLAVDWSLLPRPPPLHAHHYYSPRLSTRSSARATDGSTRCVR